MTRLECLIVTGYPRQEAQTQKNLQILEPLTQNSTVGDLVEDGAERLEEVDNQGLALSSSLLAASEGVPPKVSPTCPSRTDVDKDGNVHAKLMKKSHKAYKELQTR